MPEQKVTQGRIVEFFPSQKTSMKFKKNTKKSYAAVVGDVNENSVDLLVVDANFVYLERIPHATNAKEGRSYWDWPTRSES